MSTAFDVDDFVAACLEAVRQSEPQLAVRDVLERSVSDPTAVADALPPGQGEIATLHRSDELTIIKVVWAPKMYFPPHNHSMWAAIGLYGGQEDNTFYRRGPNRQGLVEAGGRALRDRDVVLLGTDAIHSVTNPLQRFTGAIHVYGGDFFETARSEWDDDTFEERPYDVEATIAYFEEQNARFAAQGGATA